MNRLVQKSKRLLSGIIAAAVAASMIPTIPVMAEEVKRYPWIPFYAEGKDNISNPHMQISYYILSCRL